MLGHSSKAVYHAYAKHAEVTVPSLDEWEKQRKENPQEMQEPRLVAVDFRGASAATHDASADSNALVFAKQS
ncbi:MAG TPA: hypothetical protein VI136_27125 [Verrucomicrobiae bacterium]